MSLAQRPWTLLDYRHKGLGDWSNCPQPPRWADGTEYRIPYVDCSCAARFSVLKQYEADKAQFEKYHMLWEYYDNGAWCTCDPNFDFSDDLLYKRKDAYTVQQQMFALLKDGAVWCGVGSTLYEAMTSTEYNLVVITGITQRIGKNPVYTDIRGNVHEYVAPVHTDWIYPKVVKSEAAFAYTAPAPLFK